MATAPANNNSKDLSKSIGDLGKSMDGLKNILVGYLSVRGLAGVAGAGSPNGMGSVNKAFDLLVGTIGNILMPGFVAAGAAAMMFADQVKEWTEANFDQVVENWTDAIIGAIDAAERFGKVVGDIGNKLNPKGEPIGLMSGPNMSVNAGAAVGDAIDEWATKLITGNMDAWRGIPDDPRAGKGDPAPGGAEAGAKVAKAGGANFGKFFDNMEMIVKDMNASMGSAGIGGVAAKWAQSQQELMKSDLENKQMQMMMDGIRLLREIVERGRKRNPPPGAIGMEDDGGL